MASQSSENYRHPYSCSPRPSATWKPPWSHTSDSCMSRPGNADIRAGRRANSPAVDPQPTTWDTLFLIPVLWTVPVLAPVLVSAAMIVAGVWHLRSDARLEPVAIGLAQWSGIPPEPPPLWFRSRWTTGTSWPGVHSIAACLGGGCWESGLRLGCAERPSERNHGNAHR